MQLFYRVDIRDDNANDHCLTEISRRLLHEFSLRYGVREHYHYICVLHHMIE